MSIESNNRVDEVNSWRSLQQFTDARIGLGRAGVSLPTRRLLEFQLAHASARDAVSSEPDWQALDEALAGFELPILRLQSKAMTREQYLQRPDLGRRLNTDSSSKLEAWAQRYTASDGSVALVVVDGLSASAIEKQTMPLLSELLPLLRQNGYSCEQICWVSQGRVAIGDEVAQILQADFLILLVGERPGLSSPDSLGVYYTYSANLESTDADRNCISNIREGGLSAVEASQRLVWLMNKSRELQYSGVSLKDESITETTLEGPVTGNFLLSGEGFKPE